MARPTALLMLADGTAFPGCAIGAAGEAGGEVVFNTSMSGYQEIITDPSAMGQLIARAVYNFDYHFFLFNIDDTNPLTSIFSRRRT